MYKDADSYGQFDLPHVVFFVGYDFGNGWTLGSVWVLITMLCYSLALHPDSLPLFRRPMFFHVFSIVAFLSILITYFGVNFFLGGMHSYA
jgi:ABC-type transport system involved in cytochrome c biogenesis permease subunit